LSRIASVASFFLGRIDVQLDPILKNIKRDWMPGADIAGRIYGQVAIASAKRAYVLYREFFESDRFEPLLEKGARPQRLLWASTSTKEQEFSDIKYVEALIGPNTVNTLPRQTLEAYRDHGQPEQRLTQGLEAAARVLDSLPGLDISIDQVARQLEEKGLDRFIKAYDSLMESLRESV
jgi:transaldolase